MNIVLLVVGLLVVCISLYGRFLEFVKSGYIDMKMKDNKDSGCGENFDGNSWL